MTDASDFGWLEDTYWYVPTTDLPAMQYDAARNTLAWIVDQTVWHITGYRDGYFWGICSVLIHDAGDDVPARGRGVRPTGLALLGSITPDGNVHLTFVAGAALTKLTGGGAAVEFAGAVLRTSRSRRSAVGHFSSAIALAPAELFHARSTPSDAMLCTKMIVIEWEPVGPGAATPARTMSFDQSEITIGRSPQANCCLVSDRISRLAIRIVITAEEMTLEDVSESGSTINGVHGWGSRPIREGDNIGIGPYRLSVKRSA